MDKNDVLRMTHNEYQEFLRKNAERLHTEKDYSIADYERDADRVEIVGFDLGRFGFSEEAKAIVDKMFDSEDRDRFGNVLLRGHVFSSSERAIGNSLGCELMKDNYYNGFFKNDELRCVFEFCEGDLNLVLCETEAAYREALGDYCEFYDVDLLRVMPEMTLDVLAERLTMFYKDYDYYDYKDSLEVGDTDGDAIQRVEGYLAEGNSATRIIEQLIEISNDEDLSKEQAIEVSLLIRDLKRKFPDKPSLDEVVRSASTFNSGEKTDKSINQNFERGGFICDDFER